MKKFKNFIEMKFNQTYDYIFPIIIPVSEFNEFELVKYVVRRKRKISYIKQLGEIVYIYIESTSCKSLTN